MEALAVMAEPETTRNVQPDAGPFLSPKDLADAIGVSESSLKRWVDDGRLVAVRTAGGHRRISQHEAVRFVRSQRFALLHPETLGLPTNDAQPALEAGAPEPFLQYLLAENAAAARAFLVQRYLAGVGFAALCDGPIRSALTHIGELWRHSERGIAIEHRATDIAFQSLAYLRSLLPPSPEDGWTAVGFAPSGDAYLLPTMMCAAVLAEAGWRDRNLGPDTPLVAMREAIAMANPKVVWCALSQEQPNEVAAREIRELVDELATRDTYVVLGGRGAPALGIVGREHVLTVGSMVELAAFARGLAAARAKPSPSQPSAPAAD
ncbi:MAG: helix-turn-helix domain-containing protein [Planctomycetes bacterium]|nr:helix-turn-helix domain-containing protein [Planctomycetota bacterium]